MKKNGYLSCCLLLVAFLTKAQTTPFVCSNLAYQVSQEAGQATSTLYSYNASTGLRTSIATLTATVNAIGYNTVDNFIWGYDWTNNKVARIDATGSLTNFTIANLPAARYNVGEVLPNGYLALYLTSAARYYVVDVNPARPTYLQLVDAASGFAAQTGPSYGKALSTALNINDFIYNTTTNLINGLLNNRRLFTLDLATGSVMLGATASGGGIDTETLGFGAQFIDQSGTLYAYANNQGRFYKINQGTGLATLISTSVPSNNNDGASCPTTIIAYAIRGSVFADGNGLTDNTINGTATNAADQLKAILYDNTTGQVSGVVSVSTNGSFSFGATPGHAYTTYLTTATAVVGQTAVPVVVLPVGYSNTGEHLGAGAGSDGTVDGILSLGTVNADLTNANFGIDQAPTGTAGQASPQPNPGGTTTLSVSSTLFGGTDPEDGTYPNNLTGRSVQLTPATNGTLYYNGTPVSTTQVIANFDPTQVSLDPSADGATTGTGGASPDPTFTYSVADNAGVYAPPVTIQVPFTAALPVSLVSFTAQAQADQSVLVNWQTAWEKDNNQFVIERSKDLLSFEAVGQIRELAGTSPTGSAYRFVDQAPYRGTSYYRLVQIDQDGTRQLYQAVSVIVDGHYGIWPNPVTGERLTLALDEPATAQIELHSLSGQSIGLRRLEAGTTTLTLMAESKLAAGVYLLSVRERGTSRRYRLVVL